jgi:hypothetical protein
MACFFPGSPILQTYPLHAGIPLKLRNIAFDLLMGPGEGFQSLEKPKLAKVPGMLTKQKDGKFSWSFIIHDGRSGL